MNQLTEIAKERIELAKALIRAVDKPKAKAKAAAVPPTDATKGTGDQGEASAEPFSFSLLYNPRISFG